MTARALFDFLESDFLIFSGVRQDGVSGILWSIDVFQGKSVYVQEPHRSCSGEIWQISGMMPASISKVLSTGYVERRDHNLQPRSWRQMANVIRCERQLELPTNTA